MEKLISRDRNTLRFLMTEDIYNIPDPVEKAERSADVVKENAEQINFDYSGENNRYFLVLHENKTQEKLSVAHEEMLTKIMAAKGMEMRDLAILNLDRYPKADFPRLKSFFTCSRIVLFGIDPQRIALPPITTNHPVSHSGVKILVTFSLEEMRDHTGKKRDFWTVMKDF
jgi:hypothetical protein